MSIEHVNLIVAILACGAALFFGIQQMKKKKLSWEVLSITSLVNDNDKDIRKNLKILLDEKEIDGNLSLMLLRIVNNGDIPIKAEDFNEEIFISCKYPIVWASIKSKKPGNLHPVLDTEIGESSNKITVKPLLLNSRDEFTIKILVKTEESQDGNIIQEVNSRIEGIKEIEKYKVPYPILPISIIGLLCAVLLLSLKYIEFLPLRNIVIGVLIGFFASIITETINYIKKFFK